MKIGYSRVSLSSQDMSLQTDALEGAGCERIFFETASGLREDRQELRKALEFSRPGDVIVVHALSRLARGLRHLLDIVEEMNRREIGLQSLTESIDTQTPQGRLWVHFAAALQQFEVEQLRLRTRHGLRAAALRGRRGGRPTSMDETKLRVARALITDGQLSMVEIARQVGVAPSTLYRAVPGGRTGASQIPDEPTARPS